MSSNRVLEIMRKIPGSWQLPIKEGVSVTITFFPNKLFSYVVSANSNLLRGAQIFTGDEWKGNWHIRSDKGRGSSAASSSASSADFMISFTRKTPPPQPSDPPGPYLVLNFMELPGSLLNARILGVHVDLANRINDILELFRNGSYRIVAFFDEEIHLEDPKGNKEVWHLASLDSSLSIEYINGET